uniref:Uncharacterized protein n=1 Tax=Anguilla anguilla TaxID=7936 RepID=A0A0E9UH33_ANGAN
MITHHSENFWDIPFTSNLKLKLPRVKCYSTFNPEVGVKTNAARGTPNSFYSFKI